MQDTTVWYYICQAQARSYYIHEQWMNSTTTSIMTNAASDVKRKTVEETDNGDESNYILSCASCTKSAHEYGCATPEETVTGQYWRCKNAEHRDKIHPTYKV